MAPDEFLVTLQQQHPQAMTMIVKQQAAALHSPPMTVHDVLERLRIHAPTFVERIVATTDAGQQP